MKFKVFHSKYGIAFYTMFDGCLGDTIVISYCKLKLIPWWERDVVMKKFTRKVLNKLILVSDINTKDIGELETELLEFVNENGKYKVSIYEV